MNLKDNIITTEQAQIDVSGGIGWILFKYMKKHSQELAEIDAVTGESITYGTLLQNCIRTSIKLRKLGIKKGDIITYFSQIHLNAGVPTIASLLIGAIPTFIDATLSTFEIVHLIKQVSPKLMLTDQQYLSQVQDAVKESQKDIKIVVIGEDFFEYEEEEDEFLPNYVDNLRELALIYFSSGSTGYPKGIQTTHYGFMNFVLFEDNMWIEGQPKVVHSNDSFYWTAEIMRFIASVKHGACRLINSEGFDPNKIWYILEKYKVNVAYMIPFDISQMCKIGKPKDVDLNSLTAIYCEGGILPEQFKVQLQEMLPNTDQFAVYGQTEAGLLTRFSKNNKLHKVYAREKVRCSGTPDIGAGNQLKVVETTSGKLLGPNEVGELCVKTKNVMLGYHNLDSSDRFDEDGWLKTGDLAYYDEDLCFFITGRCKELIIYQGWHVMPAPLEAALTNFPGIQKAVVIGVPHIEDGERIVGLVDVGEDFSSTVEEVEKYMEEKIPNRPVKVRIVNDIPTTPSGKVKRAELKERVLKGEI